jgi:hypothetical protein
MIKIKAMLRDKFLDTYGRIHPVETIVLVLLELKISKQSSCTYGHAKWNPLVTPVDIAKSPMFTSRTLRLQICVHHAVYTHSMPDERSYPHAKFM